MQHIAVGTFCNHPDAPTHWLKRYALLFDKVAIIDLEASKSSYRVTPRFVHGANDPEGTLADIEYLTGSGFLTQAAAIKKKTRSIPKEVGRLYRDSWSELEKIGATYADAAIRQAGVALDVATEHEAFSRDHMEIVWLSLAGKLPPRIQHARKRKQNIDEEVHRLFLQGKAIYARQAALNLRILEGVDAVCLETIVSTHVDRKANKDDLFEIIVSNMSIPDESIPWQDLLAFKNETRSIQQLRALRLWVAEMSNGKLTYGEAVDKVCI